MKKILVAIDFLDCSVNALAHAVSIGSKAGADIELVWVNKPDNSKDIFKLDPDSMMKEVEKRFQELIDDFSPDMGAGKITHSIKDGKIYAEIVHAAEDSNADLIVVGTRGQSKIKSSWMGSVSRKLLDLSEINCLVVR